MLTHDELLHCLREISSEQTVKNAQDQLSAYSEDSNFPNILYECIFFENVEIQVQKLAILIYCQYIKHNPSKFLDFQQNFNIFSQICLYFVNCPEIEKILELQSKAIIEIFFQSNKSDLNTEFFINYFANALQIADLSIVFPFFSIMAYFFIECKKEQIDVTQYLTIFTLFIPSMLEYIQNSSIEDKSMNYLLYYVGLAFSKFTIPLSSSALIAEEIDIDTFAEMPKSEDPFETFDFSSIYNIICTVVNTKSTIDEFETRRCYLKIMLKHLDKFHLIDNQFSLFLQNCQSIEYWSYRDKIILMKIFREMFRSPDILENIQLFIFDVVFQIIYPIFVIDDDDIQRLTHNISEFIDNYYPSPTDGSLRGEAAYALMILSSTTELAHTIFNHASSNLIIDTSSKSMCLSEKEIFQNYSVLTFLSHLIYHFTKDEINIFIEQTIFPIFEQDNPLVIAAALSFLANIPQGISNAEQLSNICINAIRSNYELLTYLSLIVFSKLVPSLESFAMDSISSQLILSSFFNFAEEYQTEMLSEASRNILPFFAENGVLLPFALKSIENLMTLFVQNIQLDDTSAKIAAGSYSITIISLLDYFKGNSQLFAYVIESVSYILNDPLIDKLISTFIEEFVKMLSACVDNSTEFFYELSHVPLILLTLFEKVDPMDIEMITDEDYFYPMLRNLAKLWTIEYDMVPLYQLLTYLRDMFESDMNNISKIAYIVLIDLIKFINPEMISSFEQYESGNVASCIISCDPTLISTNMKIAELWLNDSTPMFFLSCLRYIKEIPGEYIDSVQQRINQINLEEEEDIDEDGFFSDSEKSIFKSFLIENQSLNQV